MARALIRLAGPVALMALGVLPACGDLPTFIQPSKTIVSIRITGCGNVAVQTSCDFSARAFGEDGLEIQDPPLVWSSSRPGVASVSATGSTTAEVTGLSAGTADISASNGSRTVQDTSTVRVTPPKTPSEE